MSLQANPSSHRRQRAGTTVVTRASTPFGYVDALRAERFADVFPPHFHDTFAIGVVESGEARITTRAGSFVASAGAILAFAPHEVHSALPIGPDGYSYRMLYPTPSFVGEDIGNRAGAIFDRPVIHDDVFRRSFLRLHEPLMDEGSEQPSEELASVVRQLVAQHGIVAANSVNPVDRAIADLARTYLQARVGERVTLAAVAATCGLGVFELIRTFRRVVGVPPYAYLIQLRVNRAQSLLARGETVTAAAYSCGFSDQSHLTRVFRRVVGVPPGQWRSAALRVTAAR